MRIIGATLLIPALLLLAAGGVYLFLDSATLVGLIATRLEAASGTRITYGHDAALTRTLAPTLLVKDLLVEDDHERFLLKIDSLQLQISLPGLLAGKLEFHRLLLGDTRVEIKKNDSPRKPIILPSLPLRPILHEFSISRLSVLHAGEEISIPTLHLSRLNIKEDAAADKLLCEVEAELLSRKIEVEATLPRLQQMLESRLLPFTLAAKEDNIDLSMTGRIDFNLNPPSIEARVRGRALDLSQVPSGIRNLSLQGEVTGEARIKGTFKQLAMEDISATWNGPEGATGRLTGRIDNVIDLHGLDLGLSGKLVKSTWLMPVLPTGMGTLTSADLSMRISGAYRKTQIRNVNLQAVTVDQLKVSLAGQCDLRTGSTGVEPENIALSLVFSAPSTRAARAFLFDQVWEFGAIRGTAEIRSSTGVPSIANIDIKTSDPKGVTVDLRGRIDQFPLTSDKHSGGYELDVTMKADNTSVMGKRLGVELPLSGPLAVKFIIEGNTRALRLEQINLTAGAVDAVKVEAQGRVQFGNWAEADPLRNIDLHVRAKSHDTKTLITVTGLQLPELGALSAQGWLHTVSGQHRIDDFLLETDKDAFLKGFLAGSAEKVVISPHPAVEGMLLKASAATDDTAHLNRIFDLQKALPSFGALQINAQVTGNSQKIVVDDIRMKAGRQDLLTVDGKGRLGELHAANGWQPQGSEIHLSAQAPSSRQLSQLLGITLPELGRIVAAADLYGNNNTFGLKEIHILVGENKDPALKASGFVNDLLSGRGIGLDVKLNIASHVFAVLSDNSVLPDLQPLVGEMSVSDSDGSLGIDSLELRSTAGKSLRLEIKGRFDDFKTPSSLTVNSSLAARDLQLIGALFNQKWPPIGPVTVNSRIDKKEKNPSEDTVEATIIVDKSQIHAAFDASFFSNPPHLSGTVTAQNFYFPDFQKERPEGRKDKKKAKGEVFSRTPIDFNWLKFADLDLTVVIESFDKERSAIESARFGIQLSSGRLTISPAALVYPKGKLDIYGRIEGGESPQVNFKVYGEDINPWLALDIQQAQARSDFHSELDVDVEITSSGASEHELASNMRGDIYVTIKDGQVRKTILDAIFGDLVGWSMSKAVGEKYAAVNCGVADLGINQGVISTRAFFLDTQNIAIAGDGTIDLGNEQIDYVFLPKKKSRLNLKADPVRVRGSLLNPAVNVIPWKSAVRTYGSLFFAPYLFVGVAAFDYLSGALNTTSGGSPCQEYEKVKKRK